MRAAGLTVGQRHGVATVYRANLLHPQADVLTALATAAPPVHAGADEQEPRGQLAARGRIHLRHGYLEDLDLFVNDDDRFQTWTDRLLEAWRTEAGWQITVQRRDR